LIQDIQGENMVALVSLALSPPPFGHKKSPADFSNKASSFIHFSYLNTIIGPYSHSITFTLIF
ncbi:MAG: hypothetical protein ACRDCN_11755, partial [Tannerellaceae bacterium]